jgi:hypothetical protein
MLDDIDDHDEIIFIAYNHLFDRFRYDLIQWNSFEKEAGRNSLYEPTNASMKDGARQPAKKRSLLANEEFSLIATMSVFNVRRCERI